MPNLTPERMPSLSADRPPKLPPELSVVTPVFQEDENIATVFPHFLDVLARQPRSFELIAVNDGSRDRSGRLLDDLAARDPRLRVIHLARNYGQTAAMMAGFWAARGSIIVPLDADGQNPPEEIDRLCNLLEEGGYDVVSGWRRDRKDSWLRTFVSRCANWLIGRLTGVRLHDYGCTLKAYRAKVIRDSRLYGEMHRFIPVYTSMHGAKIAEVVVQHRPRRAGKSKYGYDRVFKVLADLILVRMLQKYRTKPMHFFARITQWSWLMTLLMFLLGVYRAFVAQDPAKLLWGKAPLVGVVFFVFGAMSLLLGLVAELAMRAAFEHNAGRYWEETRRTNFAPGGSEWQPREAAFEDVAGRARRVEAGRVELVEDATGPAGRSNV